MLKKLMKAGIGAALSCAALMPASLMAQETYTYRPYLTCGNIPKYLTKGQCGKIGYTFPMAGGVAMEGEVTFWSDNEDILQFDEDGTWHAVGTGEVTFFYDYEVSDEAIDAFHKAHPGADLGTYAIGQLPWKAYIAEKEDHIFCRYNPNSGEHFFTADQQEADSLTALGWKDEGTVWKTPGLSEIPVYRLYNPNAGDHHYTASAEEHGKLVKAGWNDEGVSWYAADQSCVPVYRAYNPNAKAGAHHYMAELSEYETLKEAGWRQEGTAWNVLTSFDGSNTQTDVNHGAEILP